MVAKVKMDALLEAGVAHVVNIPHPVIEKVTTEAYVDNSSYARNKPGIVSFCQTMKAGDIGPEHGEMTLLDIVTILFADVIEKKDLEFVTNAVASVDEAAKSAAAVAKMHLWREKLDGMGTVQTKAKALYKSREVTLAKLAGIDVKVDALLSEVATKLEVDKLFELTLIEAGIFLSESARKKVGERSEVVRVWDDKEEWSYTTTKGGVKCKAVARIKNRDADDPSKGDWTVTYTDIDMEEDYTAVGTSLNSANLAARKLLFAGIDFDGKPNANGPKDFKVTKAS